MSLLEYHIRKFNYFKNNMMNKIAKRKDKSWEIEFQLLNLESTKEKDARDTPKELTSKISGVQNLFTIFLFQDLVNIRY